MHINHISFPQLNQAAIHFYNMKGWVVLTQQIDASELTSLSEHLSALKKRYSTEIGCELEDYCQVISQWRDLWQANKYFKQILSTPLSSLASKSFGLHSTRLLHDHVIAKDASGGNGEIPWHQDSMYWPVDRTGMSTWMPFVDVPLDHGCLEVVSGSHLWEASRPIDFMSKKKTPADYATKTYLPVKSGSIVLLHSRTWHRSEPSFHKQAKRPVHISLWVPPGTKYYPENASWHPLNEKVTVKPNTLLNECAFPIFGTHTSNNTLGNSFINKHVGVPNPEGMFNAKARMQKDVEVLLKEKGTVSLLLKTHEQRNRLIRVLQKKIPDVAKQDIQQCVNHVWISASAYESHRSRNVFNSAYQRWENMMKHAELDMMSIT